MAIELKLGSQSPLVRVWTDVMLARFKSYALGTDGKPLRSDGYYGFDEQKVQKEYQVRTRQAKSLAEASGEVSEDDLIRLGIVPVLFTVHGTGMADPLGPGYPADVARACLDLVKWQPIGNYPAKPFPMWHSILLGASELRKQIRMAVDRWGPGVRIILVGYSQGAVVVSLVHEVDIMAPNGSLKDLKGRVMLGVAIANPMRELGKANGNKFAGWPMPTGRGILRGRIVNTPDYWLDFANRGDIYTEVPDDATGENMTAICEFVMSQTWYAGLWAIAKRIFSTILNPFKEGDDLVKAILQAGMFFGGGLKEHNIYQIGPAISAVRKAVTRT